MDVSHSMHHIEKTIFISKYNHSYILGEEKSSVMHQHVETINLFEAYLAESQ